MKLPLLESLATNSFSGQSKFNMKSISLKDDSNCKACSKVLGNPSIKNLEDLEFWTLAKRRGITMFIGTIAPVVINFFMFLASSVLLS